MSTSREDEDLELALALSASMHEAAQRPAVSQQRSVSNPSPRQQHGAARFPLPWSQPDSLARGHPPRQQQDASSSYADACPGCGHRVAFYENHIFALGRKYHSACLRCCGCGEPLANQILVAEGSDGCPYHVACHKEKYHPKCAVCGEMSWNMSILQTNTQSFVPFSDDFIPQLPDGSIQFIELPFWRNKIW